MKALLLTCFVLLLAIPVLTSVEPTAEEILQAVDEVRNPGESFFLKIEIHDFDKPEEPLTLYVAMKGKERTLIETVAPLCEQGRNLLMHNDDMWTFVPSLKKAVKVTLNQKLTGEVTNGDISQMRWVGDYTPVLEDVDKDQWVLMLKAQRTGLTYGRIRVWIEKLTYHPVKAEYLMANGKILKKVQYRGYQEQEGRMRPTEIYIQDAIRTERWSSIQIKKLQVRSFPGSIFNKRAMETHRLRL